MRHSPHDFTSQEQQSDLIRGTAPRFRAPEGSIYLTIYKTAGILKIAVKNHELEVLKQYAATAHEVFATTTTSAAFLLEACNASVTVTTVKVGAKSFPNYQLPPLSPTTSSPTIS